MRTTVIGDVETEISVFGIGALKKPWDTVHDDFKRRNSLREKQSVMSQP